MTSPVPDDRPINSAPLMSQGPIDLYGGGGMEVVSTSSETVENLLDKLTLY